MGHANISNISEAFTKSLYAKGTLTAKDCILDMEKKGITVKASEGEYVERYMLSTALGYVIEFLLSPQIFDKKSPAEPVIECCFDQMNEEQVKIYNEFVNDKSYDWDSGDDGESGQYGIFDSIPWRYTTNWRKNYNKITLLGNISN